MRIIELFAGIGACSKALTNLRLDLEIVDAVEIDKYAIQSFNAVHNTNFVATDIREYNKVFNDIDIITHGSPCQDFSIAGKQAGGDEGSGTRSSLLYETLRIVEQNKPKYVLWENVKNLLSEKHRHNFENYISSMQEIGYNSYYKVLNAKDYGIPQNRERVYTVSIRKDIDKGDFKFPEKEELKLRLKDMLENEVDKKYYLNDIQVEKINKSNFMQEKKRIQEKEYCDTILARDWKDPKCVQVANLKGGKWDKINESYRRVYSEEGISPTIHTCQGGNTEPKVVQRTPLKFLNRNQKKVEGDYAFCVDNSNTGGIKEIENNTIKIRKLTPKECWRLMGFSDEDFIKAQLIPTSNTQLYKQAGNSIVVKVLEKIFINLLKVQKNNDYKLEGFLNKITLGDSYSIIKEIPDKSIDLIIIDPPYLIENTNGGTRSRLAKSIRGMNTEIEERKLTNGIDSNIFKDLIRIQKNINIYIWCNGKQIPEYLDFFVKQNHCKFDILIWNKTNATPLYSNKYMNDKEYCLYFRKNGYCNPKNYNDAKTVWYLPINMSDKKKYRHPTIKPLNIIKTLVKNSSNEGDIVLDCFSGSGTTCVAAKELNRQYIGIEIDPEYHKISVDRLEGILANGQTTMFKN